ncbi:hypothetical protein [Neisseria zalophi]|uniref:NlpE C-terminal OB domain-containing protein n=1 Tax=Neisseria zalophi TaxID=640030 RepID=A0A5J6PWT3_9NEIS|nr:hypothetical protein [Neisseria zalophi]QEY25200.1 hypothetical protein D0T92_00655 [Neisseria zalophi]
MNFKNILAACCCVWLFGCAQDMNTASSAESDTATYPKSVLGLYTYGHEVSVFEPCGQSFAWWMSGAENVMQPLIAASTAWMDKKQQPYQPVLARLVVGKPVKATEGFPADYDGAVTVEKIEALFADQQVCPANV